MDRQNDGSWSEPRFFTRGMYVDFASDQSLYFTEIAQMPDANIAVMLRSGNGYQEAAKLSANVNSQGFDAHPALGPEDDYLVFTSRREGGPGYNELYISHRDSAGVWMPAVLIGDALGPGWKMCPLITPDGRYLMYASAGDIYWVSVRAITDR